MLSPFADRPWVVRRSSVLVLAPILVLASLLSAPSARSASTAPVELKVLEFNIEYGGVHVSFDKVVEAIRRSHADVVAIEEAQGHTLALQRALGWPYASPRFQIRYAVRWPVSVAVEDAGFVDSYRHVFPNPRRHPGLTWWAARPHLPFWNPGKYAPQDRIDIIYALGEATATAAEVIGEAGAPGLAYTVTPWPSDHRATASTFTVTPAAPPVMVAADERLVAIGDDEHVTFHAPGGGGEHVAIVPAGGHPASDGIADQSTGATSPTDGTLTFSTGGWTAAAYEAVLLRGGGQELSRIPFWVKEPGAKPSISTGKDTDAVGEPIDVSWQDARGERWDWIGVYKRGRDPLIAYYLLWTYTGSTIAGSTLIDENVHGPWPLDAGKYSVYLLRDDGYRLEARADFNVSG